MSFDTLIIDEAAQCVEPSCWIPILKCERLVLGGDHLQLQPTVKSSPPGGLSREDLGQALKATPVIKSAHDGGKEKETLEDAQEDGEEDKDVSEAPAKDSATTATTPRPPRLRLSKALTTTLFSRLLSLHGPTVRRMLTTSYRFNSSICAFPSQRLYCGELVSAPEVQDRRLTDLEGVEGEDMEDPVVFIDSQLAEARLCGAPGLIFLSVWLQRRARRCTSVRPRAGTAASGASPRRTRTRLSCAVTTSMSL